MGYLESLNIQAAWFGWPALSFFGSFLPLMTGLGFYFMLSGKTILGICAVVLFGSMSLHYAYLMVLKRRQAGGRPAAPTS